VGALTKAFFFQGRRIALREVVPEDASLYLRWLRAGVFRHYRPGLEAILTDLDLTRSFLAWRRIIEPAPEVEVWVYRLGSPGPRGIMGVLGIDWWHRRGELTATFFDLGLRERLEALGLLVYGGFRWLELEKLVFLVREHEKRFLRFLRRLKLEPEAFLPGEGRDHLTGRRYGVYRFALFPETFAEMVKNSPLLRLRELLGEAGSF